MPTIEPDEGREVQLHEDELPPMRLYAMTEERLLLTIDRFAQGFVRRHGDGADELLRATVRALLGEWTTWDDDELTEAVAVTMWGVRRMRRSRG